MENIKVEHLLVKDFQVSESIKSIRTNLMFCGEDVRVLALTSVSPAEGKSSVAFQLAGSLAQAGKKTLLIDADLRKGTLLNYLHVRGKIDGLTNYLADADDIKSVIFTTDVSKFSVMFSGARSINSSELLGSNTFKRTIEKLREDFDYIIVDSAPLGQVVDTAVIAPVVDGVLMVIDATQNSYKAERRIKKQIELAGGKVLGAILNRVDYGSKSFYGKSYGKYYGEYENIEE